MGELTEHVIILQIINLDVIIESFWGEIYIDI